MKRLSLILSRDQLLTSYKIFVRSHLDYAGIIMINLLMTLSKRNWKKFNTLQHSLLLEQLKALLGNVCTKNLVLNLFVTEGGTVN